MSRIAVNKKKLDLLFLVDATDNMQPLINELCERLDDMLDDIVVSTKFALSDIRVGVVAFRDFVTPNSEEGDFDAKILASLADSTDTSAAKDALNELTEGAAGDGPEAQAAALWYAAHGTAWRYDDAVKVTVMITDSPPHGIGEDNDSLAYETVPQKYTNCINTVRRMSDAGIILHVIGCEPTLSGESFEYAHDFYQGLTQITGSGFFCSQGISYADHMACASGAFIGLTNPTELRDLVVGHVVQSVDINLLTIQHKATIVSRVARKEKNEAIKELLQESLRFTRAHSFHVDDIYSAKYKEDAKFNAEIWVQAKKFPLDAASARKLRDLKIPTYDRIESRFHSFDQSTKARSTSLRLQEVPEEHINAMIEAVRRAPGQYK